MGRTLTTSRAIRRSRPFGAATAALVLALAAAPAAAQAPAPARNDVDALIGRAAATYKAARTATASFEQTLTNPVTSKTTTARGVLQRQGDKFNFQFTEPSGDRLVADGEWLWVYTPSSAPRQVLKLPQAAAGAGALDPGAQFFDSPRERFTITDAGTTTMSGQLTRVLTLTPKRNDAAFRKATVWLDPKDGTLRQFETVDGMGLQRRIRLHDLKVNVPVSAASFRFTPPAGVRVVDQASLTGRG